MRLYSIILFVFTFLISQDISISGASENGIEKIKVDSKKINQGYTWLIKESEIEGIHSIELINEFKKGGKNYISYNKPLKRNEYYNFYLIKPPSYANANDQQQKLLMQLLTTKGKKLV